MIANLTALRAVAAWMVVIHHMRALLGGVWAPLEETLIFAAGVDVFFVLSGVVMVVSTHGAAHPSPRQFMIRRIARVVPLYWLTTLALLTALAFGLHPIGVADWDAGDVVTSFAFWPDIRADGHPSPLLPVGWTLVYEAGFYAVFGLMLLAGRSAAWLTVGALALLAALGAALPGSGLYAVNVWTAPIILEFAFGVLLGIWWTSGARLVAVSWSSILGLSLAALLLGAAHLAHVAHGGDLITPGADGAAWRVICLGIPATGIVFAAMIADKRKHIVRNRWLLQQGDASYATYLLHLPVIQIFQKIMPETVLLTAPAAIALTAVIVHTHIERPSTRIIIRLFQQRPKSSSRRMISSSSR